MKGLGAVVADCFNRASFEGLHAHFDIVGSDWLLEDKGVAPVIAPGKEIWCCLAAQIAINALLVDVEFSSYVFGPLVVFICHDPPRFRVDGIKSRRIESGVGRRIRDILAFLRLFPTFGVFS